jgi:ubiquinone/menaquinone biosynthesis C-methylase UbiE
MRSAPPFTRRFTWHGLFSGELLCRELAWTRQDLLLGYLLWTGPYSARGRSMLTTRLGPDALECKAHLGALDSLRHQPIAQRRGDIVGRPSTCSRAAGHLGECRMPADQPLDEYAQRAARTYGAAADHYRLAALSFWDRFGIATVSRLRLAPGDTVLDVCCGAGASAIPAARAVGPAGHVLGIDVAAPQLELARARAADEELANIEFRLGDATRTGLPDGGFGAVVCVFGVFFAPDMTAFVREMWRLVMPGGVLAVTTWGPDLFEPANSQFWRCVGEVEPALFKAFNPWDEITTPAALAGLFSRAGVPHPAVVAAAGQHQLDHPGRFWDVALGSGYRATVDALSPDQRNRVRERLLSRLRSDEVTSLRTDVVFGTAERPEAGDWPSPAIS